MINYFNKTINVTIIVLISLVILMFTLFVVMSHVNYLNHMKNNGCTQVYTMDTGSKVYQCK